jgi:hypothetical protein
MSGLSILVFPPLSYKREGTQRYRAGPTQTLRLTSPYKLSSSQIQIQHTDSGVVYYAPAARTTLNPCVFLCSSRIHLAGKMLKPLLILGFRAGAFRLPAGEIPLRQFVKPKIGKRKKE